MNQYDRDQVSLHPTHATLLYFHKGLFETCVCVCVSLCVCVCMCVCLCVCVCGVLEQVSSLLGRRGGIRLTGHSRSNSSVYDHRGGHWGGEYCCKKECVCVCVCVCVSVCVWSCGCVRR